MAKNPERAEKMRIKREQMENDPDLQAARESATQSVLEKYANEGQKPEVGGAPEADQYDAETSADRTEAKVPPSSFGVGAAPPLNQPPIGKPMVPGEPTVKVNPRTMPRGGMRGRGGGGGRAFAPSPPDTAMPAPLPITPQMRVDMTDPLGVGPKWKYQKGGKVLPDGSPDTYDNYRARKSVSDAEGAQFNDDVKSGPPYTSRGFAIGHNEGRVERPVPKFKNGGSVSFASGGGSNYGKDYRKGK